MIYALLALVLQLMLLLWLVSLLIGWLAHKGRDSQVMKDLRSIRRALLDERNMPDDRHDDENTHR